MLDCKVTENMGLNGVVERRSETTPVQTQSLTSSRCWEMGQPRKTWNVVERDMLDSEVTRTWL